MTKLIRYISITLIFSLLLVTVNFVFADVIFAEKEFKYIEDTYNYLTYEEKVLIEEEISKLPEIYHIILLPSVQDSIDKASKSFYERRELSQDTILILVLIEDKTIYAYTGEALNNKGLDNSFFKQEIDNYFVDNIDSLSISDALIELINGISKDIPKYIVKEKESPKIPEPPENNETSLLTDVEESPTDDSLYLYALLVVVTVVLGFIFIKSKNKKKN